MKVSLAQRKQELINEIASKNGIENIVNANGKFYTLLMTRLIEAGFQKQEAMTFIPFVDVDLSILPEDDDYIGDVALAIAAYITRVRDGAGKFGIDIVSHPWLVKTEFKL